MLERMPRRSSVRDSQLRESLSPPRNRRLTAVWAVLAVEPCVPRSIALRRMRAAKGSVSPVPQVDLRVGAADVEPAVVVGAGDRADGERRGLASVLFGEARDQGGRGGDQLGADAVFGRRGAAVAGLPQREQQHELLEVLGAQFGDDRHGVGERVRQALVAQVVDELEDVEAQLADLAVLRLVESPDQDVDEQRFGRKEGADLLADGEVGKVDELQRSLDRVVVGERHVSHAARLGLAVDEVRVGEALAHAEGPRQIQFGASREAGVTMQVDACRGAGGCACIARGVRSSGPRVVRPLPRVTLLMPGEAGNRASRRSGPGRKGIRDYSRSQNEYDKVISSARADDLQTHDQTVSDHDP